MDTIFAVSSGAPPAAIAVLRISGPHALSAAAKLVGALPADRLAALRAVRDPADGTILDRGLILVFTAPKTATGEDLVELHLHGGRAVVAAVAGALAALPGLRAAEAGEFTRRALSNGRIDLTEAEGLGDLLSAETEGQRRAAMLMAEGGIRYRVEQWSARLLALSASIEAALDFSDEDDVTDLGIGWLHEGVAALHDDIHAILLQPPIERLRDGIRIVLAGPPNSGKSSLLNALTERDAAIVSPIAGTTRDRIDVAVQRGGIAYVFTDTAGLATSTDDPIERIGIDRARAAMATADLTIWLGDEPAPVSALAIHARADLDYRAVLPADRAVAVSAATGEGLDRLWVLIERHCASLLPRPDMIAMNNRQREHAAAARTALADAMTGSDLLLVADDLRHARVALDAITGHTDTEAMLDGLFGQFCIGK